MSRLEHPWELEKTTRLAKKNLWLFCLKSPFVAVGLQRSLPSPSRIPLQAADKYNVCNYWTIFGLSIDLRESKIFDSDGIDPFSNVTTPGVSTEDFVMIGC